MKYIDPDVKAHEKENPISALIGLIIIPLQTLCLLFVLAFCKLASWIRSWDWGLILFIMAALFTAVLFICLIINIYDSI